MDSDTQTKDLKMTPSEIKEAMEICQENLNDIKTYQNEKAVEDMEASKQAMDEYQESIDNDDIDCEDVEMVVEVSFDDLVGYRHGDEEKTLTEKDLDFNELIGYRYGANEENIPY